MFLKLRPAKMVRARNRLRHPGFEIILPFHVLQYLSRPRRRTMSLFAPRLMEEISRPRVLLTAVVLFSCMQSPGPSLSFAQNVPSAPAPQAAPPSAPAQAVHLQDYSKPRSAFPHILQSYEAQRVPEPVFGNSPRIDSLLRDGKIYLSIDDAVALTLENNLDIDIARYNLNIADTDYLRARSGANVLGVNAGSCRTRPGAALADSEAPSVPVRVALRSQQAAWAPVRMGWSLLHSVSAPRLPASIP